MREMYIITDGYFIAFVDAVSAKNDDRDPFSDLGAFANTNRTHQNFA